MSKKKQEIIPKAERVKRAQTAQTARNIHKRQRNIHSVIS